MDTSHKNLIIILVLVVAFSGFLWFLFQSRLVIQKTGKRIGMKSMGLR